MKPKFWDNRKISLFSILLYPLTFIIDLRTFFLGCFKKKVSFKKIKTICVGNIYIGGTGKTPLVKYIASELIKRGYKPGIVSRGYGGNFKETLKVEQDTPVKQTGDEAQILSKLNIPFYISDHIYNLFLKIEDHLNQGHHNI